MKDVEYFVRIAGDNLFKQWLDKERTEAIKYLTNAADPLMVHRAQGKIQLLDAVLERLEAAKNLR